MKRIKRLLKTVFLFITGIFFTLFTLTFLLTATNSGFQFLMDSMQDISSDHLQFSKVTGNLWAQFGITDLQYNSSTFELNIRQIDIHWQLNHLFNKKVIIHSIDAAGINFIQLSNKENTDDSTNSPAPASPISLPEIKLPIAVFLKQLNLSDVSFTAAPDSKIETIDAIALSADLVNEQLNIHQLTITRQGSSQETIKAQLKGQAQLTGNYPLTLQTNISAEFSELISSAQLPEKKNITVTGEVTGNLSKLQINQSVSGFIDALIKVQARQLLGNLKWSTEVQLTQFPVKLKSSDLKAQLTASGDLKQADTELNIQLSEPLQATPQSKSVQFKNASLVVNGNLSWRDAIAWQAKLQTKNINPGLIYDEWPGALDITLESSGQLSGNKLSAQIQLEKLAGQLREKPLSGSGLFHIENKSLKIKNLHLSSGNAHMAANGEIGNFAEQVNLDWSLDVKELADLLPDAMGQIKGQGNISSTLNKHAIIKAQLKLKQLSYQNSHLKHGELILALNSDPTEHSSIDLNAQSLIVDSQEIQQLKLRLNGPLSKHQINLFAQHESASLTLNTKGQFDIEKLNWNGLIVQTLIDSKNLGHWKQQTPGKLWVSTDKVTLASLCFKESSTRNKESSTQYKESSTRYKESSTQYKESLTRYKEPSTQQLNTPATLCTQLDWTPEKGLAQLKLNSLLLTQFKAYLPKEISYLSGELNAEADINLGTQLLADLKVEIKPGELVFQPFAHKPVQLKHKKGQLKAHYNNKQLELLWDLELGPHSLSGHINIPRAAIEKDPLKAPISGNTKIEIKDLNLLSIMVPQISDASGHLSARLKLSGDLDSPKVSGHAEFIADYLNILDAGIHIEDINIHLKDKNNGHALELLGSLSSGGGQLALNGEVSLDSTHGWPVTIALKGDNFLAVNTPEAYIIASPELQFRHENGLMHINGKIFIPEATLTPVTIPEGSITASTDIKVLGRTKETPANLDLNITLALSPYNQSKGVMLNAFGLKSKITGELTANQQPRQLMTAHGELFLKDGTFRAYGQDLNIGKGRIFYAGGYIDNPGLRLTASRQVNNTQVGIEVSGSANKPRIKAFSDDTNLETKDIISMLLTGQKVDNLENAKIYAGTEIGDGLSVGVNAGMGDESREFITRYKLTDKIQLEGSSSASKSGGSIIYTFEIE